MIRPTRGASGGALPAAGWFSIGAASFVIAPARRPLNWKRLLQTGSKATVSTCTHILLFCQEASSGDFTLPEPCEYDILLVCQHPHALSRERLVAALAGRTNAA